MPTFDFLCQNCETTFEFSRRFGEKKLPRCPACGSAKTKKLIAPPAIHFKGAGFFVTDSRKPEKHTLEKKPPAPESPKSDTGKSGGSEKKEKTPKKENIA